MQSSISNTGCSVSLAALGTAAGACLLNRGGSTAALLRIGFTRTKTVTGLPVSSYLAFSSLPQMRRFFSVALSLRSPSADVIRYPCPQEPGLSSDIAFRLMPATARNVLYDRPPTRPSGVLSRQTGSRDERSFWVLLSRDLF